MWLAMYSRIHHYDQTQTCVIRDPGRPVVYYKGINGEPVACTAVFIAERYSGDTNNAESVKKYLRENLLFLYSDMEYRGLVTEYIKSV